MAESVKALGTRKNRKGGELPVIPPSLSLAVYEALPPRPSKACSHALWPRKL